MELDIAAASNALGDIMKKLTVYASVALIPTLISSMYGMNFRPNSPWNMPELYWFLGYPVSFAFILFSFLLLYYSLVGNKRLAHLFYHFHIDLLHKYHHYMCF